MRGKHTRKDKIHDNRKNKTRRRKMQANNSISRNIIKKDIILKKRYTRQVGGDTWEWLNEVEQSIYNNEHFILAAVIYDYGWNVLKKDGRELVQKTKEKILQNVPSWYNFLKKILDAIQVQFKNNIAIQWVQNEGLRFVVNKFREFGDKLKAFKIPQYILDILQQLENGLNQTADIITYSGSILLNVVNYLNKCIRSWLRKISNVLIELFGEMKYWVLTNKFFSKIPAAILWVK